SRCCFGYCFGMTPILSHRTGTTPVTLQSCVLTHARRARLNPARHHSAAGSYQATHPRTSGHTTGPTHRGQATDTDRPRQGSEEESEPRSGKNYSGIDAKKIEALRRISLSSSSRRTLALSSLISASSSDVAPWRCPPSI